MDRAAWAAMNDAIANNPNTNLQVVSNEIVESLHGAGYLIVPHTITDQMLNDAGSIDAVFYDLHTIDREHRDWWASALKEPIANRQASDQ